MKTLFNSHPAPRMLCLRFIATLTILLLFSGGSYAAAVKLAWDASPSSDIAGYKIYYGKQSGRYTAAVDAGRKTEFAVPGLKAGTTYFFAVKSYSAGKKAESGYSNEISVAAAKAVSASTAGTASGAPGADTVAAGTKIPAANGGSAGPSENAGTNVNANADGLVAAYGFEEADGLKVADASGNGNHGVVKGAVRIPNGRFGRALEFDGVNDWVSVKDSPSLDLAHGMTLEAWVYPLSETGGNAAVLAKQAPKGEVYALYAAETGDLPAAYFSDGQYRGVAGSNALPGETWSHLAATYDGEFQRLYLNGVEVAKAAGNTLIRQSKGRLTIGGNRFGKEFFKGYLDEVRIYDRALSPDEIHAHTEASVAQSNPPRELMGNADLEPWIETRPQGTAEAFRTASAESGLLTQVQVYLDKSSTAAEIRVALYNDKGGHPGTRIAQGTLAEPKAEGWNAVPVNAVKLKKGRLYWIAILGTQGQIALLGQTGSSSGKTETSAAADLTELPRKWKGSQTRDNAALSLTGEGY